MSVAVAGFASLLSYAQVWTADSNLTYSDGGSYTATNNSHSLAVFQNRIYLVWYDFYSSPNNMGCQVRFKRYDGSAWSADTTVGLIGNTRLNNWYPSCATDAAGNFHLVWETNEFTTDIENFEIAYRRYNNNYWTATDSLTASSGPSSNPTIAVAGDGRLFVFWQDKRSGLYRIYYRTYAGSSWGSEGILGENADYCGMPSVAMCQGLPAVVWEDFSSGTFQVRFRKMSTGGWEGDSLISHSSLGAFSPAIAADNSGNIHVVWQDWSLNSSKICYRKYSFLSGNWGQETVLSGAAFRTESPVIVCRDSLVDVFWSDDRSGYYEIYRRQSANDSWGQEEPVTNQRASAVLPSVAADSRGNMHLVWTGDQPVVNKSPDIFIKSLFIDPWPPKDGDLSDSDAKPWCSITTFPNPTSDRSTLKYLITSPAGSLPRQLSISYNCRMDVYNVTGQLVNTLFSGNLAEGEHSLEWNGRDRAGQKVPSGIYFAKLTSGTASAMAKIMVVR
ncbi:MAG: T9SS type A sorting domain-containing protein [Candidatus Edwardsbacteria bacterium]|nr:T9SS type A sorting domain-containing protein [Candidatus Edwardsbacteria bacterium]MBU1576871.1 T9SS type A sorting domain-containing protein [Candidatus Edwardsbacteria bacterium]MBU2463446.1 T9SS type A sorting domain-containing protein [Candidatus Edwardsbacteria bacterium]MBU2593465.1 T9SS type A sorting domain-containing protein [Candidatus Edwardsbacteria bacterium]